MELPIHDPAFEEYLKLRARANAKLQAELDAAELKKKEKKVIKKISSHDDNIESQSLDVEQIEENVKKTKSNESKIFQCETCKKVFKANEGLKKHLSKKTPCGLGKPTCSDCGRTFATNYLLKRHIEKRITPCAPIVGNKPPVVEKDEVKCEYCGRAVKNMKCLEIHQLKCRIKNNKKVFNNGQMQPGMEVLLEKVKFEQQILDRMDRLENIMINMAENSGTTNNFNTLIERQNVLNINCFGQQSIDHVCHEDIFHAFKLSQNQVVPYLTKKIHGKSENNNIYMNKINDTEVLILTEVNGKKSWSTKSLKNVMSDLFKNAYKVLIMNAAAVDSTKDNVDTYNKMRYIQSVAKRKPEEHDEKDMYEMSKILFELK